MSLESTDRRLLTQYRNDLIYGTKRTFLSLYWQVLIRPRQAFERVADNPPYLETTTLSLLLFAISVLVSSKIKVLANELALALPFVATPWGLLAVCLPFVFLVLFLFALIIHMASGGSGREKTLSALWTSMLLIMSVGLIFNLVMIPYRYLLSALWTSCMYTLAIMAIYRQRWLSALGRFCLSLLLFAVVVHATRLMIIGWGNAFKNARTAQATAISGNVATTNDSGDDWVISWAARIVGGKPKDDGRAK